MVCPTARVIFTIVSKSSRPSRSILRDPDERLGVRIAEGGLVAGLGEAEGAPEPLCLL